MTATVAGERRQTGIIKLDDGFLAASSATRISTRDPQQSLLLSKWLPETRRLELLTCPLQPYQ